MMKKILSVLLMMVMLLALCGTVMAETMSSDDFVFDTNDFAVTEYTGAGGDIVIPESLQGYPVEVIGDIAFFYNETVTSVALPQACNTIKAYAFYGCTAMESVTLSENLQIIDDSAFCGCAALNEIRIPAAVGYIGSDAFYGCEELKSITFEGAVPVMGGDAFGYQHADAVFYVPDDLIEEYRAALPEDANVLSAGFNANIVSYLRGESEFEFDAATGTVTAYVGYAPIVEIPATIGDTPVTAIGESAFAVHPYTYCVIIPEGVTDIGTEAFSEMYAIKSVRLPSTLKNIGERAFAAFKGEEIAFPAGLESIGKNAFEFAFIENITLNDGIKTIGEGAFNNCSYLEEVFIPSSIEEIAPKAFAASNVYYVVLDKAEMPIIAEDSFADCPYLADIDLNTNASKETALKIQAMVDNLELTCRVWRMQNPNVEYVEDDLVTIENGYLTEYTGEMTHIRPWDSFSMDGDEYFDTIGIADGALKGNQTVKYFSVPYNDLFTTIGAEAFKDSAVETVDLFDSVTTIGAGAFENSQLTTILGGEALTSIGSRAFAGTSLQNYVIPLHIDVAPDAFAGADPAGLLLPADATDEQVAFWSEQVGTPWYEPLRRVGEESAFKAMPFEPTSEEFFIIDETTGRITAYTGTDVNVIVPRTIGGVTVTGIDYSAFNSARDYTNTEMMSNQTDWLRLNALVLPETVTYIADEAFSYCQQLNTFICYGPLENTGRGTFLLCRNLENVVFVNGVRNIDSYCFDSAGRIKILYTGKQLDSIAVSAFTFCEIEYAVVDAKTVANSAFQNCPNLQEMHFTDRCESFEMCAFSGCPSLTTVCIETDDLSFIPTDGLIFETAATLTVRTPALSAEMTEKANRLICWQENMPNIIYVTDACTRNTELPDVNALVEAALQFVPEPTAEPIPEATAEPFVPVENADVSGFLGAWNLTVLEIDGMQMNPADFGMSTELSIYEDGTAVMISDGDDPANVTWRFGANGMQIGVEDEWMNASLREDGMLVLSDMSGSMVFAKDENTEVPASAPEATAEPAPAPAPEVPEEPAAAPSGDYSERMEVKYTMLTAEVSGMTLTAAQLGGLEYSLIFHENGTCDFVMAGTGLPALPWELGTESGADAFIVDYYGMKMTAVVTEAGFDMNYMDTMLIHFEKAE